MGGAYRCANRSASAPSPDALLVGAFVDLSVFVIDDVEGWTNALATAFYIGALLGPGPRDGLMTGLVFRTGRSVVWADEQSRGWWNTLSSGGVRQAVPGGEASDPDVGIIGDPVHPLPAAGAGVPKDCGKQLIGVRAPDWAGEQFLVQVVTSIRWRIVGPVGGLKPKLGVGQPVPQVPAQPRG